MRLKVRSLALFYVRQMTIKDTIPTFGRLADRQHHSTARVPRCVAPFQLDELDRPAANVGVDLHHSCQSAWKVEISVRLTISDKDDMAENQLR
jgi:hypothetical protein